MTTDRATGYAEAVLAGDIVAGPHVRNACRRHLDDLRRDDVHFDAAAAAKALRFFEEKLRLSEGQFEGKPFKSQPAQDFIIGSLFGWKKPDGFRRFRRAYVEQGKGNGKSPLAGGIGLYGLMADGEAGAEIYSAGATKEQAGILFRDAVKMVNQSPDLERRLKPSGGPGREFNIAYLAKASFFRPVSRETKKTGSGPRPHFALVDELHEHSDSGIIETLERGFKFRRQPLLLMITNSGSDRNSVCWVEHEHAVRVAAGNQDAKDDDAFYLGEILDDSTFSFVCSLDSGDDPLKDPSCWAKANPLLGVTITDEYLAGVVAQAKAIPAKLNNILRLHFCVWTDAETAWMTRAALEPLLADFDPASHHGQEIWIGCDLSQNKDITALAFVVRTGEVESGPHEGKPTFDAWIEAWTPGDTVDERSLRDKAPYRLWVDQGLLNAPKGGNISYRQVAQALAEAAHDFDVKCVAYDRYAFRRGLEPECEELGLSLEFVEHPQGGTKKGKANEAMIEAAQAAGTVSVESALRNPTMFRAVSLISTAIGMLPTHLIDQATGKKAEDHPLYRILHRRPNGYQSAFDFKSVMQMRALVKGNGYARIVRSRDVRARKDKVVGLLPLDPDFTAPKLSPTGIVTYEFSPNGKEKQVFSAEEVLHLRGLSLDGLNGISLVRQAQDAIAIALAARLASGRLFRNGVLAGGALKHKARLSPEAFGRLKESLEAKEGAENAGKTLILEEGMDFSRGDLTAKDSQLLELQQYQVEEIARITGVPRPLLMVDETSWGSGIEALGQFFVQYALGPWFEAWQQAGERSLLAEDEQGKLAIKFNPGALLRGSLNNQADFLSKALGAGGHQPWMWADEARDLMDLPKRDAPPNQMMGHNGGPALDE